jgi:hypothetical protein
MSTPENTKSAKFSAETHEALMALGRDLGETADGALRHLLGMSTIRVEVTDIQRARWTAAAHKAGVSVDEFVRLRVEACLMFGIDYDGLAWIHAGVDALCKQAGLRPPRQKKPPAPPKGDTSA